MGAKSSRRFHPHIGFSRIILGVYSGSISHKVVHCHRHTRAQRTMLSHAGTSHLPKPGARRHRRPHTKRLAFTHKHLEMPTPPEHLGVGYPCGDMHTGAQGHTVACHEPHSTHTRLAVAKHTGLWSVARTHRHSARSTQHMHELTLSDTQKHTHELGSTPPTITHRGARAHTHTLSGTAIHTHLATSGNIFGHHTRRGVCYGHLARGSQGRGPAPSRAQDAPTANSDPAPDVSSAEMKTLSPSLVRHTQ